jgi:hypothetical protein
VSLDLAGANGQLIRPNHYAVPTYTETFTYPLGTIITDISVETSDYTTQTLSKPIEVVPNPVIIGTMPQATEPTAKAQTLSTTYEYDIGTGLINNERQVIVKVQVNPVQYNPTTNQIRTAQNAAITIRHTTPPAQSAPLLEDNNFIILCADDFADELATLETHKEARGITTKIVTLTEIYGGTYFTVQGRDNQEKIKYFIKDAIEQWGTQNVMLVGGSAKFPTRTTHVNAGQGDMELFVSDLYYADIYDDVGGFASWDTNENNEFGEYEWNGNTDDVDLYPDVYLGRLAAVSASEVTAAVNKIKTYETNEAYKQPWFSDIVLMGGDSFPGDDDDALEGEVVNDEVASIMSGFIPTRIWASNGELSSIVPTGVQNINNAINSGPGWIDFSGHGNTYVWATHPFDNENIWLPTTAGRYTNSNIKSLSNGDELPIVITGACSVGKYNIDPDCFSWSFVLNANGGGIGSFGATGLGWAYTGNWVINGLIEGMCINMFEAYANDGASSLGNMWVKAIEDYIKPGMSGTDYKTIEEWQSFCDPTTAIGEESDPPATPTDLDGPTKPNYQQSSTYSASTTDPNSDQVYYLFDWGDGTFSGWVGPYNSGSTGYANHQWTEQGDFEIRVKAKDDNGKQSDWSDPLPITTPVNYNVNWLQIFFQNLFERFPLIEQILTTRPLISNLIGL